MNKEYLQTSLSSGQLTDHTTDSQKAPIPEKKLVEEKNLARKAASQRRKQAANPHVIHAIWQNFRTSININQYNNIACYFAIGSEVDPEYIATELLLMGKTIGYPITKKDQPLIFRAWQPADTQAENELIHEGYGTKAPPPHCPLLEPDLLLVPMLAFNKDCFRLGYGGGFYDRTLAQLRQIRKITAVGLAYDAQKDNTIPLGAYDQALDIIITEKNCYGVL